MVPGGIILFDEYKSPTQLKNFPGAAKAIDEFFENNNINVEMRMVEWKNVQKFYMVKPE